MADENQDKLNLTVLKQQPEREAHSDAEIVAEDIQF